MYVDTSFEEELYSGIGRAVFNSLGNPLSFFSEEISSIFISEVKSDNQVTVIQELEMLVLLIAVTLWCVLFPPSGGIHR